MPVSVAPMLRQSTHLTKGLELLQTLPDTLDRTQQELSLQIALCIPLLVTKGFAASEVGKVYARAQELCRQVRRNSSAPPSAVGAMRILYNTSGVTDSI